MLVALRAQKKEFAIIRVENKQLDVSVTSRSSSIGYSPNFQPDNSAKLLNNASAMGNILRAPKSEMTKVKS